MTHMSSINNRLESWPTQPVNRKCPNWFWYSTLQSNMTCQVDSIGRCLRKKSLKWGTLATIAPKSAAYVCAFTLSCNWTNMLAQGTWATFPMMTEFTASFGTFPTSRAAAAATCAISVAVKPFSFPPNVPNGVLFAATINTALLAVITACWGYISCLSWSSSAF